MTRLSSSLPCTFDEVEVEVFLCALRMRLISCGTKVFSSICWVSWDWFSVEGVCCIFVRLWEFKSRSISLWFWWRTSCLCSGTEMESCWLIERCALLGGFDLALKSPLLLSLSFRSLRIYQRLASWGSWSHKFLGICGLSLVLLIEVLFKSWIVCSKLE